MGGPEKRFAPLDGVMLIGSLIATSVLVVLRIFVVPSFVQMLQEMGGPLPILTRIVIQGPFWVVTLGLAVVGSAGGLGLVLVGQREPGRIALVATVGITLLVCALVVMGLYLPVFQLAGAVQR